jgi:tetratricopeptide (TPR) repeat protein
VAQGKSPHVAIPVTAEEFGLKRRRIIRASAAVAVILAGIGYFVYHHFMDPIHAREAFDEAQRLTSITRYGQAVLACSRAIALKPDFADAYFLRATAYAAQRSLDDAEKDYSKVAQLDPQSARGFTGRCNVRLEFKDYQGAIADCSKAIELDPKNARAYNGRGVAQRYLNQLPQSLADLDNAVGLSPEIDNLFQRAATYRALNQFDKALADFDQAVFLFPGNPEVFRARAEAKRAMGNEAGAQADYAAGKELESH